MLSFIRRLVCRRLARENSFLRDEIDSLRERVSRLESERDYWQKETDLNAREIFELERRLSRDT